jgi:hypothetical protein
MNPLLDNSEVAPQVTVADCKAAMRVLGTLIETLEDAGGSDTAVIVDSLNMSYAFINATITHQERMLGRPEGMGSI